MLHWLSQIFDQLKRWVFPQKCFSCGRLLDTRSCFSCLKDLVESAKLKQNNHHGITHFYWFEYTHRLRALLSEIKFHKDRHLLVDFMKLMQPHFAELLVQLNPSSLACVPLHHQKLKLRGFNQAEDIARHMDNHDHHLFCDAFSRIKNTPALFGLKERERQDVLKEAFKLNAGPLKSPIILVDDILTTGTTLHLMKDLILKENPQAEIYFATLCFTPAPK
jgi:ComF family protein